MSTEDLNKPDDDDIVKHQDYGTNQLENAKFAKNTNDRVVVRTGDDDALKETKRSQILDLANSSGLQNGETYDQILADAIDESKFLLQYDLGGLCQFQIEARENGGGYVITKRDCEFFLLQENGDKLLAENGDFLKTQGLVP